MILTIILALILIILVTIIIIVASTVGAAGIIMFGDVIVCAFIICWIIKQLIHKRKK